MKGIILKISSQKTTLVLLLLIILAAIMSSLFLSPNNIISILIQVSIYGVMAMGMTFAIIGGEFDLSIGSIMALCGIVCVMLQQYMSVVPAIILTIGVGFLIGIINSFIIVQLKINAFIATLGGMVFYKGIALTLTDARPISCDNPVYVEFGNGRIFGIPYIVIIFIVLLIAAQFVLTETRFGRNFYSMGGNAEVTKNSGINVTFYKKAIFVITAVTSAVGGIFLSSLLNTGSAIQGDSATLMVISSVVIGGTSLAGGEGSAVRTLQGLFIFMILENIMNLLNIYSYYQIIVRGLLLILVIGLNCYNKYKNKNDVGGWFLWKKKSLFLMKK